MSVERSPKRRTLFSWLSVLVLVTSVLWWAPAAAQDATPDEPPVATEAPAPTATEPPAPTATNPPAPEPTPSATTAPEQSIQNLTTLDEDTITVTDITITCPVAASSVDGTITIDPAVDGTITLQLMAGTTELERKDQVISAATVGSVPFTLPLEASDYAAGSEVVVRAFQGPTEPTAELLDADVLKTSDPWPIAQVGGNTVCTPSTSASPTVAPSPTPSPTVDPSATVTPSPSPTATTPPNVTTGTVVNTGGAGLRCRTAPVSGTVIMVITEGSKVQVRGATENGWVPVRCNNRDGWASATYLTLTTGPAPTATPVPSATPTTTPGGATVATVVNTGGDNLRCRTAPVSGATIVSLPMGTRVEVRGATQNGWVPVKCSGQNGWMSAAYLRLETGSTNPTPTPTTTPGGTPGSGNGKYVTVSGTGGAGLRCRTAAVSGNVITLLQDGARVETRGSAVNNWVPVVCAGQAGWVSAAYVLFDVAAGSGELWFDVNLSTQYMRVFRGNTVIMQTYVSTGRPGFDTPTGTFYINRKLPTRTMTGVLGGEYYYVPNVPWVMYFTNVGHAIHGTYWHNNFGRVMSHGCINLPVSTAQYLYSITPIGTRMRIHY